jgi:hypothetical protein
LLLSSRPVVSGGRAAHTIQCPRATLFSKAVFRLSSKALSDRIPTLPFVALATALLTASASYAQPSSEGNGLADSRVAILEPAPFVVGALAPPSVDAADDDLPQAPSQQTTPPAAPATTSPTPPAQQDQSPASGVAPELKGESELGKEQLEKQEKQRVLGVIPAFNSVYEGKVPPLTPGQKMKLMWKSTTDVYVFAFAAVTAGIGQAQNSHAAYGQGVEGYAKRFGANYADTADGNFWGNAVLPIVMHEDPRYFRLGHGSFTHRFLYSMSTTVWCKRDNGTQGPNYANVMGNFIAGGISNLYYPAADRGLEQTVQSALTVTAEGIIGAELIEFWPDIAHHYNAKKQAKLAATAAANRNAQAADPPTKPIAPQ